MRYPLALDLDGVVCDLYADAMPILRKMYPEKVTTDIITDALDRQFGLTEQELMNCFMDMGTRGLLRTAKIYPGAKETLYRISRRYNIYFISWRNYIPNSREDTLYWLDSNKIPYDRLVITNNKYKVALKEKFVFFLDDNAQQCNRLAKTEVPTYLFRRPWNEKDQIDALVKVIDSWKTVGKLLNY